MAFNPPRDGKCYRRPRCVSDPKSITPEMCVKSYPNECFVVSAGKFFCTACREELFIKASVLKQHVKCAKHNQRKVCLQCKEKREHDIVEAMKAYDDEVHPNGETLPVEECVYRSTNLMSFVSCSKAMCDLIPLIIHDEHERTKKEISGQQLSMIFDGTS